MDLAATTGTAPDAPGASVPRRRALVILNPAAGKGASARVADAVRQRFAVHAIDCAPRATAARGDAARWAAEAAAAGYQLVVAVGGDGTLAEVVSGMVRAAQRVPVAFIPAGTANVAARSLAIPAEAEMAADAIAQGRSLDFDVGYAPGLDRHFVLAAAIGFPARVVEDAPRDLKRRFGFTAYVIGAGRNLRRLLHPARIQIEIDGQRRVYRSHTVLAVNAGAHIGVPLDPAVDAHDGRLQLTLMTARTVRSLLGLAVALVLRRPHHPRLVQLRSARVRISADPPQPVHLDGEPLGTTPIELETLPAAVRLIVPRPDSGRPQGPGSATGSD